MNLKQAMHRLFEFELDKPNLALDIDEKIANEAIESIRKIVKDKYLAYLDDDLSFYYSFGGNETLLMASCTFSYLSKNGFVPLMGVWLAIDIEDWGVHNFIKDVPNLLVRSADDRAFNEAQQKIGELNQKIRQELVAFTKKDAIYERALKIHKQKQKHKQDLKDALEDIQDELLKKIKGGLEKYILITPKKLELSLSYYSYKEISFSVFVDDKLIARVDVSKDDSLKVVPFSPRHTKILKNDISSIRFMKTTFKKHLKELINA